MKVITSTAFEDVQSIGYENTSSLNINYGSGIYNTPYKEIPLNIHGVKNELSMYTTEDIAFVNTNQFNETGRYYLKHGVYTSAHPIYDRTEYNAFWDEEERRCKEGMTIPGKLIKNNKGEWELQQVHITGEHYGYLNYAEIKRSKEFEKKGAILYSANGEALVKTQGGTTKEYSLPDFWDGDYYFFKAIELCRLVGRHLVVGKARRKGYSYKNGWIVANRANLYNRTTSVVAAYSRDSLDDDGTMTKVLNYLDHINKHTDWNKGRTYTTLDHIEIAFKALGRPEKLGFLSNIYTAVLDGNPGAIRGKDADLALLEEAGKCPNLRLAIDAALKAFQDGLYATGLLIVFGTGGGEESYWKDFEALFYEAYKDNFIMFQNMWDENMLDTGSGYFHPCYMNKPGLIDCYGNSDIKGSIAFNDYEKSLKGGDMTAISKHEMEEPEKPSQAFSRASNNIMPAKLLDEQLNQVMKNPIYKGIGREGIFIKDKGKVVFIDRNFNDPFNAYDIPPAIDDDNIKGKTDIRGCWILYEQPYRDPATGIIPDNLYHLWNDPFAIEKEKEHFTLKDSLGVTLLYEAANNFTPTKGDRIIGIYVGRTELSTDYDMQMFLGADFYNARIQFENDRGSVSSNAKTAGYYDILKDETEFQYQKDLQGGGKGRKKGVSIASNMNRKKTGAIWSKDWLLTKRGLNEAGKVLLNLHYVYPIILLKQLLKYNGITNADTVSALIVGMYDTREMLHKQIVPEQHTHIGIIEDNYFNNPFA